MWNELLPSAWASLTETQRLRLAPHVSAMLTKDAHNSALQLQQTSPAAQLKRTLGVYVKEQDRDFGAGPTGVAADYAWSSLSGSSAASE